MKKFDKAIWKASIQLENLRQKATEWGVDSIFGLCVAATLWPALDALQTGDVTLALSVGAAIGTNLITDHFKSLKEKPAAEHPAYLTELVKNDEALRQDLLQLLSELDTLSTAISQSADADRAWLEDKLNQELAQWGQAIKVDRSIHVQGDMKEAIANTGDNPVFNVTIVEKQVLNPAPTDPLAAERAQNETARQQYLQQLYNHCQDLPLDKFGEDITQSKRIKLNDVYIELNTRTLIYEEKEGTEQQTDPDDLDRGGGDTGKALSAIDAAQNADRLVILGDPGSGKSTFAKRLLGLISQVEMQQIEPLAGFPVGLTPVLINLRDLVPQLQPDSLPQNAQKRKSTLQNLILKQAAWDVETEYQTPTFAQGISRSIISGNCYLLLDGFDEVPQDLRGIVREAVAAILTFNPQRVLVTCRIRSYTAQAELKAFDAHTLAHLTTEQIWKFCHDWYRRQSELGRVSSKVHATQADDFYRAATEDIKLLELAGNPMLLTTMAIVHQKETRLPPERVKLFQEVVKILLFRWQKHHGNEHIKDSLRRLLIDEGEMFRAIEHLAYAAHQAGKGDKEAADLPRKQARDILEDHHLGSAELAEDFLDYIDERSGILIGRGGAPGKPHTYALPHRFLQEYLAGCHLAGQQNRFEMVKQFKAIAEEGDFWDEVALLAFEELQHNRRTSSLWDLADMLVKDCDLNKPCHHRLVLWSGQIANLIGNKILLDSGEHWKQYIDTLKPMLLQAAQGTLLNPIARAEAANALDGLDYVPGDLYTFVEIPGDVNCPSFWIGKYPVTNRQYERFLTQENFADRSLWMDLPDYDETGQRSGTLGEDGWHWLHEKLGSDDILFPRYWHTSEFGRARPNAPVVGVSWYEAMAYGRWLQRSWEGLAEVSQNLCKPELIRLPVNTEWEKAAGGIEDDRFAWDAPGETSDRERVTGCANTAESGIGRTTPVWTYPQGQSNPYKLADMSGNVWEWQADRWEVDRGSRVVRGGSFDDLQGIARCASRYGGNAVSWSSRVGFRLCLRP